MWLIPGPELTSIAQEKKKKTNSSFFYCAVNIRKPEELIQSYKEYSNMYYF